MIFLYIILAPIAGALFVLGYAPFNLWFMPLLSIFLLLVILDRQPKGRGLVIGWMFGLGLMGTGVSWIYNSMHIYGNLSLELASIFTALFCISMAFFYALFGYIYCALVYSRQSMFNTFNMPILVRILIFASLWTLLELLRSHLWTGFPWLLLGNAFIDTYLSSWAPLGGVFTIGFIAALTVTILYHLLRFLPVLYVRRNQYRFLTLLLVGALPWGLGAQLQNYEWTQVHDADISVLLVQANTQQETKWRPEQINVIANIYHRLSVEHTDKQLLVWPEAAVPYLYPEGKDYYADLDQLLINMETALIFGSLHKHANGDIYNALFSAGAGSQGVKPVYYKRTLVPMGEYVPLQAFVLRWFPYLHLGSYTLTAGRRDQKAFPLGNWRIAPSICYEVTDGQYMARMARRSHFMLSVSNDSWFADSLGPHQHLHIARMRAAENQRYLVRATNNGVTATIDHRGRLVATLPQFQTRVLSSSIVARTGVTPYQLTQDIPIASLALILFLFGVYVHRREIKRF